MNQFQEQQFEQQKSRKKLWFSIGLIILLIFIAGGIEVLSDRQSGKDKSSKEIFFESKGGYSIDENKVYFQSSEIGDADPNSFQVLSLGICGMEGFIPFARDNDNLFIGVLKYQSIDIDTFRKIGQLDCPSYFKDNDFVYFYSSMDNKFQPFTNQVDSFQIIDEEAQLTTDGESLFFRSSKIPDINLSENEFIGHYLISSHNGGGIIITDKDNYLYNTTSSSVKTVLFPDIESAVWYRNINNGISNYFNEDAYWPTLSALYDEKNNTLYCFEVASNITTAEEDEVIHQFWQVNPLNIIKQENVVDSCYNVLEEDIPENYIYGEKYEYRRNLLINDGWNPVVEKGNENSEYPEITNCGSGWDFVCYVEFKKNDNDLNFMVGARSREDREWIVIGKP